MVEEWVIKGYEFLTIYGDQKGMLCRSDVAGYKSSCFGDSGGPLARESDSSVKLIGIVVSHVVGG